MLTNVCHGISLLQSSKKMQKNGETPKKIEIKNRDIWGSQGALKGSIGGSQGQGGVGKKIERNLMSGREEGVMQSQ